MTEYNLKYKHIKHEVINAVRKAIIEKRIFKQNQNDRFNILKDLLKELCEIYNINEQQKPNLKITELATDGFYNSEENSINLNKKLSLITFLHEFKHFLQIITHKENSEEIARGYSISLFYKSSPRHFERALRKGFIIHQKPTTENQKGNKNLC